MKISVCLQIRYYDWDFYFLYICRYMISNVTLTPAGPRQASLNWIAVIGALLSTRSCKLLSKIMETLRRSNSRNEKNPSGIRDYKERWNDEQNYPISTCKSLYKIGWTWNKKVFLLTPSKAWILNPLLGNAEIRNASDPFWASSLKRTNFSSPRSPLKRQAIKQKEMLINTKSLNNW